MFNHHFKIVLKIIIIYFGLAKTLSIKIMSVPLVQVLVYLSRCGYKGAIEAMAPDQIPEKRDYFC